MRIIMIRNKKYYLGILPLLLFCCLFFSSHCSARTTISDGAQLLTTEETENLTTACDAITDRYDTSVYIITSKKLGKNDDYTSYIQKIGKNKSAPKNLVILFVGTKKDAAVYNVTCYGKAKIYLTDSRCRKLESNLKQRIAGGDYFDALYDFCNDISNALGHSPRSDAFPLRSLPQLLFSMLAAATILYLMLRRNSSFKDAALHTCLNKERSHLLGHLDHFLDATVSKKAKNSSSGNGREK